MTAYKPKLELTWIGKENRPKLEPRILIEDTEKSYGNPKAENMLIQGDNLLALKALEQEFSGKVKCVFIDPPYNTGSAFEHYDDGLEHSLWLSLMRDRLEIIQRLLSEDGSLWITIDDNEGHYLKVLCDEVFGRSCFIANIVWRTSDSSNNNVTKFSLDHNDVLIYARNKEWKPNFLNDLNKRTHFKNPDNDPRGPWFDGNNIQNPGLRPNLQFDIIAPNGNVIKYPPNGWRWSKETIEEKMKTGEIRFSEDGKRIIRRTYLVDMEGLPPSTLWTDLEETGHNRQAKYELKNLFPEVKVTDLFGTPKPERFLHKILLLATNPNDLVLDSFLGSGTTAAVAHKMGRRWIGIELGEHCNTHCLPRLQKVVDGTDQGGISEAVSWKGGGGFKFYNLAPSLLKKDKYGNFVIDEAYNANMLAAAMAKHEGFQYQPDGENYWKQGGSTERDFIFTTTQFVTVKLLDQISQEMKPEESVLICCKSFQKACENKFQNITIKKIPKMLLGRCEFGKNDYSLNIVSMPPDPDAVEFVPSGPEKKLEPEKKKRKPIPSQMTLMD